MFERMVPLKSTGSCGTCVRASSQTDDADDAADEVAVEVVDVDAVGIVVEKVHGETKTGEQFGRGKGGGAVGAVHQNPASGSEEMVLFPDPEPPTMPMFSPGRATMSRINMHFSSH